MNDGEAGIKWWGRAARREQSWRAFYLYAGEYPSLLRRNVHGRVRHEYAFALYGNGGHGCTNLIKSRDAPVTGIE